MENSFAIFVLSAYIKNTLAMGANAACFLIDMIICKKGGVIFVSELFTIAI
jgi:hypothetical protein